MIARLLFLVLLSCNKYTGGTVGFSSDAKTIRSERHTEHFTPQASGSRQLDILLVVDNSGSMMEEQDNLAKNLDPLLEEIKDSDWQIALTTTDARDCVEKIITPANMDEYATAVRGLGVDGSGDEVAVWKIIQALQGNCIRNDSGGSEDTMLWERALQLIDGGALFAEFDELRDVQLPPGKDPRDVSSCDRRKQWLRKDSTLAILLLTDEDHNCNKGYMCGLTDLYFYLNSIRTLHATARLYGLLDISSKHSKGSNISGHGVSYLPGASKYLEWKDHAGESLFDHYASINADNYAETLHKISQNISAAMQNTFMLQYHHDGRIFEVKIKHGDESRTLAENEYLIENRTLKIISTLPANTEQIEVLYTHNPDQA